uniref:Peptidase M12B domain-containing protein n=1 Tax=Amblyomma maculatum TaxID=34609 RepID=G3MKY3_AMBMU
MNEADSKSMPPHEIPNFSFFVYPKILESRADDSTLLLHINEGFILNLKKSSILAKDLAFTSFRDDRFDTAVLNGEELEMNLYEDSRHQASVNINILEGTLEVRGMLNHELRIFPVDTSQRSDSGNTLHEIVKLQSRQDRKDDILFDALYSLNEEGSLSDRDTAASSVLKSHTQNETLCNGTNSDIGTPRKNTTERSGLFAVETCIVTTEEYTCAFNTTQDLVMYLAIFLNAAALVFHDMTNPAVRLQLNHVITNVSDNLINKTDDGVNIHTALHNMKELAEKGAFNRCDVAVLLSSEDMFRMKDNTTIEKRVMGIAYIAGVCKDHKVSVGEDMPHTYSGVLTAAHELAHLLGADHDNSSGEYTNIPGYPGSLSCPLEDGYLMSYTGVGKKKHRLSNCSMEQIRFIYRNLSESCIQVRQQPMYTTRSYPGQNITRRQFCQTMHKGKTNPKPFQKRHKRHEDCQIKCCWKEEWTWCQEHTMPEGLVCGPGKRCRRGVCESCVQM